MRLLASLLLLLLPACGEAIFKAPRPDAPGLDGAPPKSVAFPAGEWSDDYGDIWKASVDGEKVSAIASCGPRLGSVLAGKVADGILEYGMSDGAGAVYATGQARLINDRHAFFETSFKDGSLPAEGLLHFLHDAPPKSGNFASQPACVDISTPPLLAAPTNPKP